MAAGVVFVHWRTVVEHVNMPASLASVEQHLLLRAGLTFFLLLEVDRIKGEAKTEEAKHLSRGFLGSNSARNMF